jgi:tetratricopeptide (TPR) repeat protein
VLTAAPLGLGCAGSPGAAVAADAQTARTEQSADKLVERGRAFAEVRDYTRAEQYLSAALDAGAPPAEVLPTLLKACIAENRFRAALTYAEPQLRAHPEDFRLRFVVASLYASIGDTVAALDHLERVAAARPDHAEVHYALAVLLRDGANDPARADIHFREYLRLEPDGPHAPEARGSLLTVVGPTRPEAAPDQAPGRPTERDAPAAPAPGPVRIQDPAAPARPQDAAAEPGPRPAPVRP